MKRFFRRPNTAGGAATTATVTGIGITVGGLVITDIFRIAVSGTGVGGLSMGTGSVAGSGDAADKHTGLMQLSDYVGAAARDTPAAAYRFLID